LAKIVGAAGIDLKPEQDFTWIERAAAYTLRDEIYAENLQQYQSAVDNTPRPSPSILDRPKQGFAIPLSDWLRGPLREMVGDLLGDTRFRERGVFDAGHATRMLDAHLAGHADHGEHLWSMLAFESWARALLDAPPDDDDPEPVASRPAMAAAQG
jgi:asparagine synthetase B (glutamine-hydrolysing)